jgi:hypothetical protein
MTTRSNVAPPNVFSPTRPVEATLAALSAEMARKADRNTEEVFTAILLRAPGGAYWRVSVNDTGALVTTAVVR